ncbi:MAG TPA: hypothetical protein GXX46_00810 [Peptococcaceae bacterium]|nr:hypothetical protein [Peptococcaceae bacterium]
MSRVKLVAVLKAVTVVCLFILILALGGCASSVSVPTETSKKEAAFAVESFAKTLSEFNNLSDTFQAYLGDLSSGDVDLDLYRARLESLHNKVLDLSANTKSLELAAQYKAAHDMLVTAVVYLEGSILSVITYFDDHDNSLLTLAKNEYKQALRAAYLAEKELKKQAKKDGYQE